MLEPSRAAGAPAGTRAEVEPWRPGRAAPGGRVKQRRGQVVVEMLLILPVFFTIVFTIMEMGYLAFWMIVLNHATFEAARIGGMIASPSVGSPVPGNPRAEMDAVIKKVIKGARVDSVRNPTLPDNQAGSMNYELVVTGKYDLRFVFPMSSILMSSKLLCPNGPGGGTCTISAVVRMPIEQPLQR